MRMTLARKIRGVAAFDEANFLKATEKPLSFSTGAGLLLTVLLLEVERAEDLEELFLEELLDAEPVERDFELPAIISRYLLFP